MAPGLRMQTVPALPPRRPCASKSVHASSTQHAHHDGSCSPCPRPLPQGLHAQRRGCQLQQYSQPVAMQRGQSGRTAVVPAALAVGSGASEPAKDGPDNVFSSAVKAYQKFMALAGKFMPMVGLFFLLAFVNTILDSLKDTLVITAVGGGAQVIPYLTVYAVLPSSLIFLVAYSFASQWLSRAALFNAIVAVFMGFFCLFAFVLYPNHHLIHPHAMADSLAKMLPSGVEGLVGMFRNWTFTLFFCMSELWGDVCLGLLFWGLANDTTTLADAPTLYPLFGLGANVAQALAGTVLKAFSGLGGGHSGTEASFGSEIQALMVVVLGFSVATVALHAYIDRQHKAAQKQQREAALAKQQQQQQIERLSSHASASSSSSSSSISSSHSHGSGNGISAAATADTASSSSSSSTAGKEEKEKAKPSVGEIFRVLAASVPIRCLAVMSLAQGLCTSLMEFAWKSHISLLFPSPAEFTSFLGDVSMWQGVVTGGLMVLSPAMFDRMGWKGVAGTTPIILLWGGVVFFAACMTYQFVFASHAAAALAGGAGMAGGLTSGVGGMTLQFLVFGGALLYVFSKSAKFSLFKPAEEMVYISLDEEGRTKGKAAIDVVGSQAGKSGGSVLQQVLLLASGGAIAGILPVMFACFFAMAQGWLTSVNTLSAHANYGHAETVHASVGHDSKDPSDVAASSSNGGAHASTATTVASSSSNGHGSNSKANGSGNGNGSSSGATNGHAPGNGNGSKGEDGQGVEQPTQPQYVTVHEK